ncbi:MAG TPA: hypothetical protein VKO63_06250 [Chitinispirillaceae bacterium]|nr:hypothetical protein [Chitinispirillaceae bacterium]
MIVKKIPCTDRLRRVPEKFSWIDHRLVQDKRICGVTHSALALYLFLVTVGDADGVSYYSDTSIQRYLMIDEAILSKVRKELCTKDLIAYQHPFYQVVSLDKNDMVVPKEYQEEPFLRPRSELSLLGDIFRQATGGK